jgi:hypothetical protein
MRRRGKLRGKLPRTTGWQLVLPGNQTGAHAELMGWKLATRDVERYGIYFPAVELIEPTATS